MLENLEQFSLNALCQSLQVSRSGFFACYKPDRQPRRVDHVVKAAFEVHKGRAGSPCRPASAKRRYHLRVGQRRMALSGHHDRLVQSSNC